MLAFFCKKSAFYFAKTVPSLKPTQQTFALLKTSLSSEDVLIKTNIFALVIRLEKTFSRRLDQDQHIRLNHTSSIRLQDVFKTSSRRLAKTSPRHLQDIFKRSSKGLQDVLQKCLQDVLKTHHQVKLFA